MAALECVFFPLFCFECVRSQLSISFCVLQDKTMFSVPWKHAARHGWEIEKDASLFKLWAIHTGEKLRCKLCRSRGKTVYLFVFPPLDLTLNKMLSAGKYVEGQTCDPKTWKANFRCAMNSLPDIKEVKDRSVNKGHQAVRVFKMLPAAQKCRGERGTDRV